MNEIKSGIELIAQERKEQIEKHGYTKQWVESHPEYYDGGEMAFVSEMLLASEHEEGIDPQIYPKGWEEDCQRMLSKPYKERLIIADKAMKDKISDVIKYIGKRCQQEFYEAGKSYDEKVHIEKSATIKAFEEIKQLILSEGKDENDVTGDNATIEASVVSLTCTDGNSIQQDEIMVLSAIKKGLEVSLTEALDIIGQIPFAVVLPSGIEILASFHNEELAKEWRDRYSATSGVVSIYTIKKNN